MSVRAPMAMLTVAAVCLLMAGHAYAFFPFGGFTEVNQQLRFMTWPLDYLDTNRDGDVGTDEGVRWTFEGEITREYPAYDEEGHLITIQETTGWTEKEQATLKQGFQVWEDVPTSYAAFYFTNPVTEPLYTRPIGDSDYVIGEGLTAIDMINYVAVEDPGEETLPAGVLGVTLFTIVLEDTVVEMVGTGMSVPVSGGQIVECDIVYSGAMHRERTVEVDTGGGNITTQTIPAMCELLATHVHEVGHSIGLAHTPLNNFSDFLDDTANTGLVAELEQRVYAQRNSAGQLEQVGVTPTMYPIYFATDLGDGKYKGGMSDLAPDDMAGVSYLYPRGSQSRYFELDQEVRSQTRLDFPSAPLPGAHVIAWSDADSNVGTRRVPMFSTMAGLYQNQESFSGYFKMINLLKQHETIKGVTFDATYVFTSNPLNGLSSPTGYTPEDFDSTHVLFGPSAFSFITAFPSEVFNETQNLLGIESREQGTPLIFNMLSGQVVSATTGKSLSTMLPGTTPMFGARNDVCWLNVVVPTTASMVQTPKFLRNVRDQILLNSAIGTAVMDAYYQTAPPIAQYLSSHPRALGVARGVFAGVEWVYARAEMLLVAAAALLVLGVAFEYRRWRLSRQAAGILVLAGLLLAGGSAHASLLYMSDEEMVKAADNVLVGTVEAVESYYIKENVIVTDITIRTEDNVKGHLNKGGQFVLRQPGGRVGPVLRYATDLAEFKEGEEVLLFLQTEKRRGPAVVCGERGKLLVQTDPLNGEKYVVCGPQAAAPGNSGKSEKDGGQKVAQRVELEAFKDYLREMDKQQKAEEEVPKEGE
ncbi:MAG TPA: hypothetical protein PLJ71_16405 [Candidatus Hydrogenedentes bacterium]|nr:hypothetical protein [Candidatus Hydrogenedentota bacterium]HQM50270.1 hypothetical protein [Candidatus Hydrogenedentota bacterium]